MGDSKFSLITYALILGLIEKIRREKVTKEILKLTGQNLELHKSHISKFYVRFCIKCLKLVLIPQGNRKRFWSVTSLAEVKLEGAMLQLELEVVRYTVFN